MIIVDKIIQFNRERTVFWALFVSLLFFVFLYIYCANSTVRNAVMTQNIESKISALSFSLNNKEFQYISSKNSINLNTAKSLGFKETEAKSYISINSTKEVSLLSQ